MSSFPFDISSIFEVDSDQKFNEIAMNLFRWQASNVPIYQEYINSLGIKPSEINQINEIPFLPIQFFKSKKVIANNCLIEKTFQSSGTTETGKSKHFVADIKLYEQSFTNGFIDTYGEVENTCILALLPNYLEQGNSSLIYMIDSLINKSKHPKSGFILNEKGDLLNTLLELKKQQVKTVLIGVTYALLDFIESYEIDFPELIVMETGGMKGRRKEIIRTELHQLLCNGFGVSSIHSEYGMTELLSQAYSTGNGIFTSPPWMKIVTREISDPLTLNTNKKAGGINVIDLANVYSCSFIATQDLGRVFEDNSFEVIGRFDNSDTRGCNLMVQ